MPDYGIARCDFTKGNAADLIDSFKKLYHLDENIWVFFCHDYLLKERQECCCESSIVEQKNINIHLNEEPN